jgi:branched-chain amino acid transport system ATP-binding protein
MRTDLDRVYSLFPRLAGRRRQMAGTLSGDEQQMLAPGRALTSRPRVICMDEPTRRLDPTFVDRVLDAIVDINRSGTSIFPVEENANASNRQSCAQRRYLASAGVESACRIQT